MIRRRETEKYIEYKKKPRIFAQCSRGFPLSKLFPHTFPAYIPTVPHESLALSINRAISSFFLFLDWKAGKFTAMCDTALRNLSCSCLK